MWGHIISDTSAVKYQTENIVDDLRRPLWDVSDKIPTDQDFLQVLSRYELFAGDSFELIDEKGGSLKGKSDVKSYVTSPLIKMFSNFVARYKVNEFRKDWSAPVRVYLNDDGHYIYESKNLVTGEGYSVTAIVSRNLTEIYAKTVKDELESGALSFAILFITIISLYALQTKRQVKLLRKIVNEQQRVLLEGDERTNVGKRYGEHLGQLSSMIIKMHAQANEAYKTNTNILQDVSHETNSCLTEIKQSADLIRYYGLEDQKRVEGQLKRIDKAVSKISAIQGAFTDLAKIENLKALPPPSVYSVKELVNYAILEASSEYHKVEFVQCCWTRNDKQIRIHREHFKMITKVLLDNAVKYSINSHEVKICILEEPSYKNKVAIKFTNWGVYVPEEEKGRIFERYYRARSVRNMSGVGIGLHIVKKVMNLYDGEIIVESDPSGETSFIVIFPEAKEL